MLLRTLLFHLSLNVHHTFSSQKILSKKPYAPKKIIHTQTHQHSGILRVLSLKAFSAQNAFVFSRIIFFTHLVSCDTLHWIAYFPFAVKSEKSVEHLFSTSICPLLGISHNSTVRHTSHIFKASYQYKFTFSRISCIFSFLFNARFQSCAHCFTQCT